jgi:hypothetical protein
LRKLLIMGLPGAGKTTLAKLVAKQLNAANFNADDVRAHINKDLGFSLPDRIEHAARMGWLCDRVVETGGFAVADFICPLLETREAFFMGGPGIIVFVDRVTHSRYPDTDAVFMPPFDPDVHVRADGSADYWADQVVRRVRPVFNPEGATALIVGRFQPFHDGHKALAEEGIRRAGQVFIGVRLQPWSVKNPYTFEEVQARIEHAMRVHEGRFCVAPLPNISHVLYGRDVGYLIEKVELGADIEAISATEVRARVAH